MFRKLNLLVPALCAVLLLAACGSDSTPKINQAPPGAKNYEPLLVPAGSNFVSLIKKIRGHGESEAGSLIDPFPGEGILGRFYYPENAAATFWWIANDNGVVVAIQRSQDVYQMEQYVGGALRHRFAVQYNPPPCPGGMQSYVAEEAGQPVWWLHTLTDCDPVELELDPDDSDQRP